MSDHSRDPDQDPVAPFSADAPGSASLLQSAVVHDVNQMLAVILGRTELLRAKAATGAGQQELDAIALAAEDAAAMLKRLYEGATQLPPKVQAEAVSLAEAVRAASLMIRPGGAGQWQDPEEGLPADSWVLDTEVSRQFHTLVPGQVVREVLCNLLVNALEVLPRGGTIRITAAVDGPKVTLTVSDSGPGLDKTAARRIFEPGFTTSDSRLRGIGLAGCRHLLDRWGGSLELGPDQETGAQFLIELPRAEAPATLATGDRHSGVGPAVPADLTVLVVDDEPAVRDMLGDVLEQIGCPVTSCRDAKTALAQFTPGRFGLALVDQSLPGLSGLELVGRLREQDPLLVVVVISGWGQEKNLAGADPSIVDMTATKPLAWSLINEILAKGEKLYRRRQDTAAGC